MQRPELKNLVSTDIITSHALSIMIEHVPNLADHFEEIRGVAQKHGTYPDGSVFFDGSYEICSQRLWDLIIKLGVMSFGVWQPKGFGGLQEFGGRVCGLYYTQDYRESLGENDMQIRTPNEAVLETKPAYCLKDLGISVVFKRKPSQEIRQRFAQSICEWGKQIRDNGVCGEGPVKIISPSIEFRGRLAQFRIDVSRSGQHSLNWLLIWILNFGYSTSAVADMIIDHDDNLSFVFEGSHCSVESIFGKSTTVPIHQS
jgi:hypothetical protein